MAFEVNADLAGKKIENWLIFDCGMKVRGLRFMDQSV